MRDLNFHKPTDFVLPHAKEAVKMYIVYDGSNRMVETYTAIYDAVDGQQCLKTEYAYDGASTRITKMQESLSNWDESWDI